MSKNNKRNRGVSHDLVEEDNLDHEDRKKPRLEEEDSTDSESCEVVTDKEDDKEDEEEVNFEVDGQFSVSKYYDWMTSKQQRLRKKKTLKEIAEDEKQYDPIKQQVDLPEEDSTHVECTSDDEKSLEIDYENVHLAFDPEKSPRFP